MIYKLIQKRKRERFMHLFVKSFNKKIGIACIIKIYPSNVKKLMKNINTSDKNFRVMSSKRKIVCV